MKLPVEKPLIYLISDGTLTSENLAAGSAELLKLITSAIRAHIPLIQLREKKLPACDLYELAKRTAEAARGGSSRILINDRVDIALAAGLNGVHLTSRSVPADVVRRFVPNDFLVGVSAHSIEEIESAKNASADFAVFGPIFDSPGKGSPIGLDILRRAVDRSRPFPVLGLGGVDESNYHSVLDTGAAGFAGIRFLNNADNLRDLAAEYDL